MDKAFLEGLASLVNVKAEDVAELFVTEGEETKLKDGVNPLEVAESWIKTRLNDTYKAAERKTATRFESWVKDQGFESDAQGTDLLAAFVETVKTKPAEGGKASEWEKKYNDLAPKVEGLQKKIQEVEAEKVKAIQDANRKIVTARLRNDVRSALGEKWAGKDDHLNILMNNFNPDRIQYDGDTPVLLDEKGERMIDELHRPINFSDRVKQLGELIGGYHAVNPGQGGPPPPNGGGGNGSGIKLKADMTADDFNSLLLKTKDPDQRKALIQARKEQLQSK